MSTTEIDTATQGDARDEFPQVVDVESEDTDDVEHGDSGPTTIRDVGKLTSEGNETTEPIEREVRSVVEVLVAKVSGAETGEVSEDTDEQANSREKEQAEAKSTDEEISATRDECDQPAMPEGESVAREPESVALDSSRSHGADQAIDCEGLAAALDRERLADADQAIDCEGMADASDQEDSGVLHERPFSEDPGAVYQRNREALLKEAYDEQAQSLAVNRALVDSVSKFLMQQAREKATAQKACEALFAVKAGKCDSEAPNAPQNDVDRESNAKTSKTYQRRMHDASALRDTFSAKQDELNFRLSSLSSRLETQDGAVTKIKRALHAFKREIARSSISTRTGKLISKKVILQLESEEASCDSEIEGHRLKNIHYTHQLAKLERDSREKEELADGSHLIDFEQLKIENQTLNEKIEERNEEHDKLRKKITTTVLVLTHVKEKLHFVTGENAAMGSQLAELSEVGTSFRDELTALKRRREAFRKKNVVLKQRQGFVGSQLLVADFESRKAEILEKEERLASLKHTFKSFSRSKKKGVNKGRNTDSATKNGVGYGPRRR